MGKRTAEEADIPDKKSKKELKQENTEEQERAERKAAKKEAKRKARELEAAEQEGSDASAKKSPAGEENGDKDESDEEKAQRKAAKKAAKREASAKKSTASSDTTFDSFDDTPFRPSVLQALKSSFTAPTPIQSQAWPAILAGSDLVAVAKTGSGKTLAFLLPLFHSMGEKPAKSGGEMPAPRVLVMAPTRELAMQIQAEVEKFGGNFKGLCIYGGVPVPAQITELKKIKPSIVVATPGRLGDMLARQALSLKESSYVVLDEADRMLDMGFEPQIKVIFEALPTNRQTLFFTATWPQSVRKLASSFLREGNIKEVFIGGGVDCELEANKAISQCFIKATDDEKDKKLYEFLCKLGEGSRVVVFANTKRRAEQLSKVFWNEGFGTCSIHGDKTQGERDKALKQFINDECPLMFATDVAARGLDIKGVTHVVNFDMARDVESYVHRIGRTGRAGELGQSVTFWNPDYDTVCAPALVKIARDANQEVPDWLAKYEKTKTSKQWKVDDAILTVPVN